MSQNNKIINSELSFGSQIHFSSQNNSLNANCSLEEILVDLMNQAEKISIELLHKREACKSMQSLSAQLSTKCSTLAEEKVKFIWLIFKLLYNV